MDGDKRRYYFYAVIVSLFYSIVIRTLKQLFSPWLENNSDLAIFLCISIWFGMVFILGNVFHLKFDEFRWIFTNLIQLNRPLIRQLSFGIYFFHQKIYCFSANSCYHSPFTSVKYKKIVSKIEENALSLNFVNCYVVGWWHRFFWNLLNIWLSWILKLDSIC